MRQSYAEHFVPRPQLGRLCADGRVNNCLGAASASTATCAARGRGAGTEPRVLGHSGCPHATATIPMEGLGCAKGTAGSPMPSRSADRRDAACSGLVLAGLAGTHGPEPALRRIQYSAVRAGLLASPVPI